MDPSWAPHGHPARAHGSSRTLLRAVPGAPAGEVFLQVRPLPVACRLPLLQCWLDCHGRHAALLHARTSMRSVRISRHTVLVYRYGLGFFLVHTPGSSSVMHHGRANSALRTRCSPPWLVLLPAVVLCTFVLLWPLIAELGERTEESAPGLQCRDSQCACSPGPDSCARTFTRPVSYALCLHPVMYCCPSTPKGFLRRP